MKARFHRLARLELKSAVEYYNREEPGLGDIFGRIVREATSELRAEPQRWPVFEGRIRRYFLKKFRYVLLYAESQGSILVVAVMHSSRKPGYWKYRVD